MHRVYFRGNKAKVQKENQFKRSGEKRTEEV